MGSVYEVKIKLERSGGPLADDLMEHAVMLLVCSFLEFWMIYLLTLALLVERLCFINTGPSAVPPLITMSIEDGHEGVPGLTQLDPVYSFLVVLINARPTETEFASISLKAKALKLYPVQLKSYDEIVKSSAYETISGCFSIPARTTSVFVEPQS